MNLEKYFVGSWRLERKIIDLRQQKQMGLLGRAELKQSEGIYKFFETGDLDTGQGVFKATQEYFWQFIGPDNIHINFTDDRLLVSLKFTNNIANGYHFCSPDQYDCDFEILDNNSYASKWRVIGPAKNYQINNLYLRIQPD